MGTKDRQKQKRKLKAWIKAKLKDSKERTDSSSVLDGSPSRRTILQGIGTASATVGLSGTAAALSDSDKDPEPDVVRKAERHLEVKQSYETPSAVKAEVEEQAPELLKNLAERNFIDQPSIDTFSADSFSTGKDFDEIESGILLKPIEKGDTVLAHITLVESLSDSQLRVHVEPETNRSYAVIDYEETDKLTVLDPTNNISSTDCEVVDSWCKGSVCNYRPGIPYPVRNVCCKEGDMYDCHREYPGYCCIKIA